MAIVWNGLALLFFVSLFMVSVSVFTPKTALFFKEKTKIRGAILWMSAALVCAVLVNEFGPGFVPQEENAPAQPEAQQVKPPSGLPGYSFRIIENRPGEHLAIDCALAAPVSENTLRQLALKVFSANRGGSFKKVQIRWLVESSQDTTAPWAVTLYEDGNWSMRFASP